jgi:hypothetical protein
MNSPPLPRIFRSFVLLTNLTELNWAAHLYRPVGSIVYNRGSVLQQSSHITIGKASLFVEKYYLV